jgi:hypothetical protein
VATDDDFFGGVFTEWVEPDRDAAAWSIAASLNTLVRGWCFDPARDDDERQAMGEFELDPWVVETTDADWIARGQRTLDLAVTWWDDLPSDWQARFVELAEGAARLISEAVSEGRTPEDLVADEDWLSMAGAQLQRPWLKPRRVIALKGGVVALSAAGPTLAAQAVHVYARSALGIPGTPGTVHADLPSALPDRAGLIRVGGPTPADTKSVSFIIDGDRLTADVADEIETLVGQAPDRRWQKGDLHLQRTTGRQYRPYRQGHWTIGSENGVSRDNSTLEERLEWLLDLFEPHAVELRRLLAQHRLGAQFFCFYSQTGYNADWELSARTISRIAVLGASFRFDSYGAWDDDEDEDGAESNDEQDGDEGHDEAAERRP